MHFLFKFDKKGKMQLRNYNEKDFLLFIVSSRKVSNDIF